MSEFLYQLRLLRPGVVAESPTPAETESLRQHVVYLEDLAARGILRLAGRTQLPGTRTFGIALLRGVDAEQAAGIMRADPAVRDGVRQAELFPFRTAVDGLAG